MASGIVKCEDCGREFQGPGGLATHRRKVHDVKGPVTLCPLCGKRVAVSYMKEHQRKYHYGSGVPVPIPRINGVVDKVAKVEASGLSGRLAPLPVPEEVGAVNHDSPEFTIRVDEDGVWVRMSIDEFANVLRGFHHD